LSLVKTSSMLMTGPEYSSTTSLTASSLYILKQPGQHITDPIMFCELLIIQKSVSVMLETAGSDTFVTHGVTRIMVNGRCFLLFLLWYVLYILL
jgi:hypothetical protein